MAYIDKYGVEYSDDRKALIKCPENFEGGYEIFDGTKEILNEAFADCSKITAVVIPQSVLLIGERAFANCSSMTEVLLPSKLLVVEKQCFQGCTNLSSVILGEQTMLISAEAFADCTSLVNIKLSENISVIYKGAFRNCSKLVSFHFPPNIKYINPNVFCGCESLMSFSVDKLNDALCSFSNCIFSKDKSRLIMAPNRLTELTIPIETCKVNTNAFENCKLFPTQIVYQAENCEMINWGVLGSKIESIVIDETVRKISDNQFSNLENLKTIICKAKSLDEVGCNVFNNTPWKENSDLFENGILYLGNSVLMVQPDFCGKCVINEGVSVVADKAFAGVSHLISVKFLSPLSYIGTSAFSDCKTLRNVDFSGNIKRLKASTFKGCELLTSIVVPRGITIIEKEAFCDCKNLVDVSLPDTLCEIHKDVFKNCISLIKILIPPSVSHVNGYDKTTWFDGCVNLKEAEFHYACAECFSQVASQIEKVTLWGDDYCKDYTEPSNDSYNRASLKGFTSLEKVIIHKNIPIQHTKDYTYTPFYGKDFDIRESIKSIYFIDTKIIPYSICQGLRNLENVSIGEGCETISQRAFCQCATLTMVQLPSTIKKISATAFEGCFNIKNKEMDQYIEVEKVQSYHNEQYKVFTIKDYNEEEELVIPEGYQIIKYGTFEENESLISVVLPSTMLKIEDRAFYGCKKLKSVSLNEGLLEIGSEAFEYCNLGKVNLPSSLELLGDSAFGYCNIESFKYSKSKNFGNNICGFSANILNLIMEELPDREMTLNYILHGKNVSDYYGSDVVKNLIIGSAVKNIPSDFFSNLRALETVTFEANKITIEKSAFYKCTKLTTIATSNGHIIKIGDYAFGDCHNLVDIDTSQCEFIGNFAFRRCYNLQTILVSSCKEIGRSAFDLCHNVKLIGLHVDGTSTLRLNDDSEWGYDYNDVERRKDFVLSEHVDEIISDTIHITNQNIISFGCGGLPYKKIYIDVAIKILPSSFFANCELLETVILPYGIREIGSSAFYGCRNMKNIIIPDSVEIIGEKAFCGCIKMENIKLPDSLKDIGAGAFAACSNLKCISFHNNVTQIPSNCFAHCAKLQSVVLPPKMQKIEDKAFFCCTSLSDVAIPRNVIYIGNEAFSGCVNLSSIVLPEKIRYLGGDAFFHSGIQEIVWMSPFIDKNNAFQESDVCNQIKKIQLGKLVRNLPFNLNSCQNLEQLIVDNEELSLSISYEMICCSGLCKLDNYENGILYYNNMVCSVKNIKGKCVIKEGTKIIEKDAFRWCKTITEIVLPNTIEKIGEGAFCGCDNLVKITLPKKLKQIPPYAFAYNHKLVEIVGGENVTKIGASAFNGCSQLNYSIPNSVIEIEDYAFQSSAVSEVSFPQNLVLLGKGVFADTQIVECVLPDNQVEIPDELFMNCHTLKKVQLPNTVTIIGVNAFRNCENLESIELPNKLLSIGEGAFSFNSYDSYSRSYEEWSQKRGLKSIEVPESVKQVGDKVFANCNQLVSVVFNGESTQLGESVFEGCVEMTKVVLPTQLQKIPDRLFMHCEKLEKVSIPMCNEIGSSAFNGCIKIRNVKLPNSLKTIGSEAFANCPKLDVIELPSDLSIISHAMFAYCVSLKNVIFPSNLQEIESEAFSGCENLQEVNLPNTITSIADEAFRDCEKLYTLRLPEGLKSLGRDCILNTKIKQLVIPSSIENLDWNLFYNNEELKYVFLLCPYSEDWGGRYIFHKNCMVFSEGQEISKRIHEMDDEQSAQDAYEQYWFEKDCEDGIRAAFEGDPEATGGIWD